MWDAAPINGKLGEIEELPEPTDRGMTHGFKVKNNTNACISDQWKELEVYFQNFPLDETWNNRTPYPWHCFTTKEKAEAYSKKGKNNSK